MRACKFVAKGEDEKGRRHQLRSEGVSLGDIILIQLTAIRYVNHVSVCCLYVCKRVLLLGAFVH
jgi:hypothetical protein